MDNIINKLNEKFNDLVNSVSSSTNGMFDVFYNLCKNFIKEVDDSVVEGKKKEELSNLTEEELG